MKHFLSLLILLGFMFVAKSESNKCEIFDDSLVCIEAGCNYNYLSKSCKEFPDLNQQCKVFIASILQDLLKCLLSNPILYS